MGNIMKYSDAQVDTDQMSLPVGKLIGPIGIVLSCIDHGANWHSRISSQTEHMEEARYLEVADINWGHKRVGVVQVVARCATIFC